MLSVLWRDFVRLGIVRLQFMKGPSYLNTNTRYSTYNYDDCTLEPCLYFFTFDNLQYSGSRIASVTLRNDL